MLLNVSVKHPTLQLSIHHSGSSITKRVHGSVQTLRESGSGSGKILVWFNTENVPDLFTYTEPEPSSLLNRNHRPDSGCGPGLWTNVYGASCFYRVNSVAHRLFGVTGNLQ